MVGLFDEIPDPRASNVRYKLSTLLFLYFIAICAKCETFIEVETFLKARRKILSNYIEGPVTPSHDTLERVMSMIDPVHVESLFRSIHGQLQIEEGSQAEQIALDGKYIAGSGLNIVSAFNGGTEQCLASACTEGAKRHEIKAMQELVAQLNLAGAVVSIDAMGANKQLMCDIVQKQADYVIGLKRNQKIAFEEAVGRFEIVSDAVSSYAEVDLDRHGVIEREYWSIAVQEDEMFPFAGVKSIIKTAWKKDQEFSEVRYYLSTIEHSQIERLASYVRGHWSIELQLSCIGS